MIRLNNSLSLNAAPTVSSCSGFWTNVLVGGETVSLGGTHEKSSWPQSFLSGLSRLFRHNVGTRLRGLMNRWVRWTCYTCWCCLSNREKRIKIFILLWVFWLNHRKNVGNHCNVRVTRQLKMQFGKNFKSLLKIRRTPVRSQKCCCI